MAIDTSQGLLKLISYVGVRRQGKLLVVEYKQPPNPDKTGWWIPAPEAAYGEDPLEVAQHQLAELGFADSLPRVMGVESFTMGARNWHVIVQYVVDVERDPAPGRNIARWAWYDGSVLPDGAEFAHKRWEEELARQMLRFVAARASAG